MAGHRGLNLGRFTCDGAYDPTFAPTSGVFPWDPGVPWDPSKLALQPDGKVLVGNKGGVDGSYPAIGLTRFLPDGTRDPDFHFHMPPDFGSGIWSGFWTTALAVESDGNILVAGCYERDHFDYWYWSGITLQRLRPDGSEGEFFAPLIWPEQILVLPDQRLLLAGNQLVRLNADGTEDTGFTRTILSGGKIRCCVTQPDGKILVGGTFTDIQGQSRCRLARVLPDGQLDLSFTPPVSTQNYDSSRTTVSAIAVQSDGRILVGGNFETMNGLPYVALARLNSDGSLDTTFPPVLGLDEDHDIVAVNTIVIQDGNRAIIGGQYLVTPEGVDAGDLLRISLGEPSLRLSILQMPGRTELTFPNPGPYDFSVLSSTNLSLPISNWTVLGLATNIGGNLYRFTHEFSPSETNRFYQLHPAAAR